MNSVQIDNDANIFMQVFRHKRCFVGVITLKAKF
jgi:hypothetical protein